MAIVGKSTATLANVASSATSVTVFPAATGAVSRRVVFNDSSAILYLKLGATASLTSFTAKIAAGGMYELPTPTFTGLVDGIWDSANGFARTTQY
jgi:hypothetical protein